MLSIFRALRILLVLVFLMTLPQANADRGGWVASGGELFRFGKNPWFVKNTGQVDYCVDIDRSSISASEQDVMASIVAAIDYWKNEFAPQGPASAGPGFLALGTQTFNRVSPCASTTPLQFRIGAGALQPDELQFLEEPNRYVGVTVRKEYDHETLVGSGIVYISSDKGPSSYDQRPNSGQLVPQAWTEKKLLTYALIHEMGHVFGIPHTGTGLMSEVFLEQLLHKKFVKFYLDRPIETFLTTPLNFDVCSLTGSFNSGFFQIPNDTYCIRFTGSQVGGQIDWTISTLKKIGDIPVPAGTIKVSSIGQMAASAKPAVLMQLPPEQKVFSLLERNQNTFMIGPVFGDTTARGVFQTLISRKPNDLQIELRTDSIVMSAIVSGKMSQVLVYSPPSLLNKIFPIGP